MTRIAFIGLGNMGGPMAANLVKAGHAVRGYDLVAAHLAQAAEAGVSPADSAEACVRDAEVVITMLPAGKHVVEVVSGCLPAIPKGALIVDCSTIDPASARRVHEMAAAAGSPSLDAPVSGGITGAAAATLTFMVGGEEAAFAAGRPILEAMGKRVVLCGGAGAGQSAKICNNMIAGITMIGVSEAFVLAGKLGLSAQALFEVASTSSGQCWALTSYCPAPGILPGVPSSNGYKAGFAAPLMLKDLRLSQEAAASVGAATPLGARAAELYSQFTDRVPADRDFSGIIEFLAEADHPASG
ncbi:3-hydroxyisobutyrate dehydrogenase [Enterovirga sp.]|jgi:3-hydroxyisobutyrate dehydrogenase|uniref:3-hydroxyisobutyrate dehydrogenase n=1 Tax=Enterovirga sp. TaxID=2026350 RepID=UPI002616C337|nr:3-hydroxyisobutyrate dehydrogenase [Enterovirga sp.]MDB5592028.1 3-hydroxyisobutyrate dehydrogenase [Enterovirga sp.]